MGHDELEDLKDLSEDPLDRMIGSNQNKKENPVDIGGPGRIDNEKDNKRGEQQGQELDVFAENRPRNDEGEFLGKEDIIFDPFK